MTTDTASILIVYASTHGHTEKIALRIAARLTGAGARVEVREASAAAEIAPPGYDAVIAGGSIHAGSYQAELVEWARRHATALDGLPSAFFSVCLTAADDSPESREATRGYVDKMLEQTGWTPHATRTFAGALQYREYDFATRLLMRLMMKRGNHPTDVRHDYDYTDWDGVDRFADDCLAMAAGARA
jgi:menaquinone-dependent protoporphyrinogen oxidase